MTALSLNCVLGFNSAIPGGVINLSNENANELFFVAGNTGVIYDSDNQKQKLLRGHCNSVLCCCASTCGRWVVTADYGEDGVCVIWDTKTGKAIKTFSRTHNYGVVAMDLSADSQFLVTLGKSDPTSGVKQMIAIWQWQHIREDPLIVCEVPAKDEQTCVRFNTVDSTEIVTNGNRRVLFWKWVRNENILKFYGPPISAKGFKKQLGNFSQSLFVPKGHTALSCTTEGDLIVWANENDEPNGDKKAIKLIRLSESPIRFLTHTNNHIVVGDMDGAVRVYDFRLRLISWFEDLNFGPITSISFARNLNNNVSYFDSNDQTIPDFLIATSEGNIVKVRAKEPRNNTVLCSFPNSAILCVSVSTFSNAQSNSKAICAIGCESGLLLLYNIHQNRVEARKQFDSTSITALVFDDIVGLFLCAGFANGLVRILDSESLNEIANFKTSRSEISFMTFSNNTYSIEGEQTSNRRLFLATADLDNCVTVFECANQTEKVNEEGETEAEGDETKNSQKAYEWKFSGKFRSHCKRIVGLVFVNETLFSLGEDRNLVEYFLDEKSALSVKNVTAIDATAIPTAMTLITHRVNRADHEHADRIKEILRQGKETRVERKISPLYFLIATDHHKFKQFNYQTKKCHKTTLICPSFLDTIERLCFIRSEKCDFVAFALEEKILGTIKLPLDGNPYDSFGLIGHSSAISGLQNCTDGLLLSCGVSDHTLCVWRVDNSVFEQKNDESPIAPFAEMIDGGENGPVWKEMLEYFNYAQLRRDGEDSMHKHTIGKTVPISQIANLVRAFGFYPTEQEIQGMEDEVRYSLLEETGELVEEIDFETLIKLHVNHRPVFGTSVDHIAEALKWVGKGMDENGDLEWDEFAEESQLNGEKMSSKEMVQCLISLLGDDWEKKLPDRINAREFAEDILGFESYEDREVESR